jgi:hypothetical protein
MNNTETAISHKGKQTISGCKDDKRTKKQTDIQRNRQTYKETDRPIKAHKYLWLKKSSNYTRQE